MADTFGITSKNSDVFFCDQYNTPIRSMELLRWAIEKYGNDANFVLKVDFKPKQSDEIESLITSEVMLTVYIHKTLNLMTMFFRLWKII